jgi:hypothetical protein
MGACIKQVPVKSIDIEGGDITFARRWGALFIKEGRSPPALCFIWGAGGVYAIPPPRLSRP